MRIVIFIIIVSISFTFCKKRKREAAPCENPYSSANDTVYLDIYTPYLNHIDGLTYVLQANNWAGNTNSFVWSTGDTANSIIVSAPDDYTLYTYSGQWVLKDSTIFSIGTLAENIQVPNSFTPDGDGINDIFKPIVYDICENSYSFRIYDKYNLLIFQSNMPAVNWDGTYKGMLLPLGYYTYQIEATTIDGEYIVKEGTVNLLK